jgi:hypothetical protein
MGKRSHNRKFNFTKTIEGIAQRMQLEFDYIFGQLPYDVEKGRQCEKALIKVLQDFLPQNWDRSWAYSCHEFLKG